MPGPVRRPAKRAGLGDPGGICDTARMPRRFVFALVGLLAGCGCDDARARGASTPPPPPASEPPQFEPPQSGAAVLEPASRESEAPERTMALRTPARPPALEGAPPRSGDGAESAEPVEELVLLDEEATRTVPPSELWMELVHDGPLARATHPGGGPMYQGQQIEQDGRWVRHGRFEAWYPDGQAWEAGSYYLDRPHGLWEWWYEDGTPQARGDYEEGQHTGPWTYWYENGQVMATGVFRADKPVGVWRLYDEQGNLVDESDRGP